MFKKRIGYVLIIVSVLIGAMTLYMSRPAMSQNSTDKEAINNEIETTGDTDLSDASSFSSLDSCLQYNLHSDIEKRLNASAFDKALVSFLEDEGVVSTAGYEGGSFKIAEVKDAGEITVNLDDGSWWFYIDMNLKNIGTIMCIVDQDGVYKFYDVVS